MRDLAILLFHLIVTLVRLFGPGGLRSVVAETLLVKHQLLVLSRSRERAPNLRPIDRVIAGVCAGLMRPARLLRSAIVLKPSTIMAFQRALVTRKYQLLFTPKRCGRPGPKGPTPELIAAIVQMKRRNPRFGYQRIAQQRFVSIADCGLTVNSHPTGSAVMFYEPLVAIRLGCRDL